MTLIGTWTVGAWSLLNMLILVGGGRGTEHSGAMAMLGVSERDGRAEWVNAGELRLVVGGAEAGRTSVREADGRAKVE